MNTSFAKPALDWCYGHRPVLFGVLLAATIALPFMGLTTYALRVVIMIGIYILLALGLNILVGYTGLVSIGNAGFYAIGAYTSAILVTKLDFPVLLAMLCAAVMASIFGLIIGAPTLRMTGHIISIVTLGFGEIVRLVLLNWDSLTGGALGIRNIPVPDIFGLKLTLSNNGLYYFILVLVIAVALGCRQLINSKIGRAFRSIKNDELAAVMMGIRTSRYKLLAFVLSAFVSGLAGSCYAHLSSYIDSTAFTLDVSMIILCIVILGGMGTTRGMIFGAVLLISFPEFLRDLPTAFQGYRFVAYGLVLVLMMRYRPQGVLGWRSRRPYSFPRGLDANGLLVGGKG